MEDYAIGQSILIQPETQFAKIASTLENLGWQRTDEYEKNALLHTQPQNEPQHEPEFSSWTWHGKKPILIYSFNPIAKLRVLDVATLPPSLRGQIVQHLPILEENDINDLLFDPIPRKRMLALWAMQETEKIELSPQAHRLAHDNDHNVAELAKQVEARLDNMQESRESLMMSLTQLAQVAEPIIRQLNNPAQTAQLKPSRAELNKLFDPAISDALMRNIEQAYFQAPYTNPGSDYPELSITAVNAGLLRWSNEFSRKFPQGYRHIAGWMQPQWIWLSWRWHSGSGSNDSDSDSGIQYDGLVWIENRWVWLPKAYRLVAEAIAFSDAPTTMQ